MGLEGFLEPWAAHVRWLLEDLCYTKRGAKEGLLCHSSNGFWVLLIKKTCEEPVKKGHAVDVTAAVYHNGSLLSCVPSSYECIYKIHNLPDNVDRGECAVRFLISYPGEDKCCGWHAHQTTVRSVSISRSERSVFAALSVCLFPMILPCPRVDPVPQRLKKQR